jgi:hypothetical protein
MAVSRRLRFEILRRDQHTCRYCGAKAPDVTLAVDHVIPITLGGGDEPNNLVTACTPCNAGKSSMPADAAVVEDVDATAVLFARALTVAAERRRADRAAMDAVVQEFGGLWKEFGSPPQPEDWYASIERFYLAGLDSADLFDFAAIAATSRASWGGIWKYFCGCCWREITDRQELARRLIEDGEV